jgi:hypothetical protein
VPNHRDGCDTFRRYLPFRDLTLRRLRSMQILILASYGKAGAMEHSYVGQTYRGLGYHNKLLETDVNRFKTLLPVSFTAPIMTTPIKADSSAYSIAVAPSWSGKNCAHVFIVRIRHGRRFSTKPKKRPASRSREVTMCAALS